MSSSPDDIDIDIDSEVDNAKDGDGVRDELPGDLDVTRATNSSTVSPYTIPDNRRRRIGALILGALGVGCIVLRVNAGGHAVYVNQGFLWSGVGLIVLGLVHWLAGYPLRMRETDALVVAGRTLGYPVGPASAQLRWRGLRSRPIWHVLVYSAEDQPTRRGLVVIDGVNGGVLEWFSEENPEDFAEYAQTVISPRDSSGDEAGGTVSGQVKSGSRS